MSTEEELQAEAKVKEEAEAKAKKESEEKATAESKKAEEHMIPKSRLDEEIQKRRDAEKRAGAMDKAAKDAETKRLKEQEDYKALYDESQKEITELTPKAEKYDDAEATLKDVLKAQVELIPEEKRQLVPTALSTKDQLAYIAENQSLLSKADAFNIGAGKRGGSASKSVVLTEEEKEAARKAGVSEEDYAKNKN